MRKRPFRNRAGALSLTLVCLVARGRGQRGKKLCILTVERTKCWLMAIRGFRNQKKGRAEIRRSCCTFKGGRCGNWGMGHFKNYYRVKRGGAEGGRAIPTLLRESFFRETPIKVDRKEP